MEVTVNFSATRALAVRGIYCTTLQAIATDLEGEVGTAYNTCPPTGTSNANNRGQPFVCPSASCQMANDTIIFIFLSDGKWHKHRIRSAFFFVKKYVSLPSTACLLSTRQASGLSGVIFTPENKGYLSTAIVLAARADRFLPPQSSNCALPLL